MSNNVYDIANVLACQDCVIIMTNGDTSALNREKYTRWVRGCAATSAPLIASGWDWSGVQCYSWNAEGNTCDCGGNDHIIDGWFSWSACEWCGDTDGGNRFNVAIMRKVV